jgi:hypothetical protein
MWLGRCQRGRRRRHADRWARCSPVWPALRLTDTESDHLHLLAGTAPNRTRLHRRDVRPSILALLERLAQRRGRQRLVSMPLNSQLTKEQSLTRFISRTNDPEQRG